MRVLVTDDNDAIRRVTARLLKVLGHEAVPAASGAEALEILGGGGIDAVILDLFMPEMSGAECFNEIRKHDATIPIIIASGVADGASHPLLENDEISLLRKPFKLADLKEALETAQAD